MTQATLNHALRHPNDEIPTPEIWFRGMEKKAQWEEKEIFKGKTLLCPCDDYEWSGFARYFIPRFGRLGIKKLICRSFNPDGEGKLYIKTQSGITIKPTEGHGDFREEECERLKAEADLLITNPPYSQKADYYAFSKTKPFITILPVTICNRTIFFDDLKERRVFYNDTISSHEFFSFGELTNIANLVPLRRLPKHFRQRAKEGEYERYDNYNAIHIRRLSHIPEHCSEAMGVPATIFEYAYDNEYEVVGRAQVPKLNGKNIWSRILIKEKR